MWETQHVSSPQRISGSSPRMWETQIMIALASAAGSSPRMWETHRLALIIKMRFIPTHVGNTYDRSAKRRSNRFIPTHVGNT